MDVPAKDGGSRNGAATNGRAEQWHDPIALNRLHEFLSNALNPTSLSRASLLNGQLDPRRSVDDECGYPPIDMPVGISTFKQLYDRCGPANRLAQLMPKECFQVSPAVYEDEDADTITAFEQAWDDLGAGLAVGQSFYADDEGSRIWEYLMRADTLSRIGQFGVILLGIDDGKNLQEPVDGMVELSWSTSPIKKPVTSPLTGKTEDRQVGVVRSITDRTQPMADSPMSDAEQKNMESPQPKAVWDKTVKAPDPNTPGKTAIDVKTKQVAPAPLSDDERQQVQNWAQERQHVRNTESTIKGLVAAGRLAEAWQTASAAGVPGHLMNLTVNERRGVGRGYQLVLNAFPPKPGQQPASAGPPSPTPVPVLPRPAPVPPAARTGVAPPTTIGPSTPTPAAKLPSGPSAPPQGPASQQLAVARPPSASGPPQPASRQATPPSDDNGPGVTQNPQRGPNNLFPQSKGDSPGTQLQDEMPSGMSPRAGQSEPGGPGAQGTDRQYGTSDGAMSSGYGMPPAAMSGTDAQYYGVQMGPSEQPATGPATPKKLLFVRCFDESLVQVVRYEWNIRNPRFGMPVMYRVTLNDPRESHSGIGLPLATVFVHWSRIIHLADVHANAGASEIFAPPIMRPVLNYLLDLYKVPAAASEGYWQSGTPTKVFSTHPQLGGDVLIDKSEVKDDVEQVINSLQKFLLGRGGAWSLLAPSMVDPTPYIEGLIKLVCMTIGIPMRVFMGSERGELASTQDDASWNDRVRNRQNGYVTPRVICPFVDRLISCGVLPEPQMGYRVEWPDLDSLTDKDKAAIFTSLVTGLGTYAQQGIENYIPIEELLSKFTGGLFDEEEVRAMVEAGQQHAQELQLEQQQQQQQAMEQGFEMAPPPGMVDPKQQDREHQQAMAVAQNPAPVVAGGGPPGMGGPPGAGGKPPFGGKPGGGGPPGAGGGGGGFPNRPGGGPGSVAGGIQQPTVGKIQLTPPSTGPGGNPMAPHQPTGPSGPKPPAPPKNPFVTGNAALVRNYDPNEQRDDHGRWSAGAVGRALHGIGKSIGAVGRMLSGRKGPETPAHGEHGGMGEHGTGGEGGHGEHGPLPPGAHEIEHTGHEASLIEPGQEITHRLVADLFGGHEAAADAVAAAHEAAGAAGHAAEAEHLISHLEAGAIVAGELLGPAIKAATYIIDKVPGGHRVAKMIGAVHDAATKVADKLTKKLADRYGPATAAAILASGHMVGDKLAGLGGPVALMVPGKEFVGAIPALALAEAGKRLGLLGKDSRLEKSLSTVGTWVHAFKHASETITGKAVYGGSWAAGRATGAVMDLATGRRKKRGRRQQMDVPVHNLDWTMNAALTADEIDTAAKQFYRELSAEMQKAMLGPVHAFNNATEDGDDEPDNDPDDDDTGGGGAGDDIPEAEDVGDDEEAVGNAESVTVVDEWWNGEGVQNYSPEQPRAEDGRWSSGGDVGRVDAAVRGAMAGHHADLKTGDVTILMGKLNRLIDSAKRHGLAPPKIDLCEFSVPGTNLFCEGNMGVHRDRMPQLGGIPVKGSPADRLKKNDVGGVDIGPLFVAHMREQGVRVSREMADPLRLKATQDQLNGIKVAAIAHSMDEHNDDPTTSSPLFVSNDGYIIDGHHRWAAYVARRAEGKIKEVPVYRVHKPIMDVINEANAFAAKTGLPSAGFASFAGMRPPTTNSDDVRQWWNYLVVLTPTASLLATNAFNPDQPRDDAGRWAGMDEYSGPNVRQPHADLGDSGSTDTASDDALGGDEDSPQARFPHLKHLLNGTRKVYGEGLTRRAAAVQARGLRKQGVFAGFMKDPKTGKHFVFNFSPDQPRVPAGSAAGGQFAGGGGAAAPAKGRGANFGKKVFGEWTGPNGSVALIALKPEEQKALPADRLADFWKARRELERINKQARGGAHAFFNADRVKAIRENAKVFHDRMAEIKAEAKKLVNPADVAARKAADKAAKAKLKVVDVEDRPPQVPVLGVPQDYTKDENVLASTPLVEKKRLGGGVNGTFVVTLADGTKGVWKPVSGEARHLRDGVKAGTYYLREAGTSAVAKVVGLNDLVPTTVVRKIGNDVGSLQKWADNSRIAADVRVSPAGAGEKEVQVGAWRGRVPAGIEYDGHGVNKLAYDGDHDLARLAAFDALIGNTDRHLGNWMVQGGDDDISHNRGKLVAIDNGLSFPVKQGEFRSFVYDQANSRGLKVPKEVLNWDPDKISAKLLDLGIEHDAVMATMDRLSMLQDWARQGKAFPRSNRQLFNPAKHDPVFRPE